MFTLIRNAELYGPWPLGRRSVLLVGERIARLGDVDASALRALKLPLEVIDAGDHLLVPGFVDPHEHVLGAGGEQGFASRLPEVPAADLLAAGITTVVGCLGTDGTTRNLTALLGKVRQLEAAGLTAFMYTGGFPVPTPTITESVVDDLVLIDKVIGVGEVAIADVRSSQPTAHELARLVSEAHVGASLSGKAGVVHFHVGPGRERLARLFELLDDYEAAPGRLYPTHVNRSEALMDEAIALARRGAFVDTDTIGDDTPHWLRYYLDHGGPPARLTVSSDSHTPGASPAAHFAAFVACVREQQLPIEQVLPFFTANPAAALRLPVKGRLEEGLDADLVVLERETLRVAHLFCRGRRLVADGQLVESAPDS